MDTEYQRYLEQFKVGEITQSEFLCLVNRVSGAYGPSGYYDKAKFKEQCAELVVERKQAKEQIVTAYKKEGSNLKMLYNTTDGIHPTQL